MNCSSCEIKKIGPFGGYLCTKGEHLQCYDCNILHKSHCAVCDCSTKFIQMNYISSKLSVKLPYWKDHTVFNEIDIQSRLSMENLSMKDSKESMIQNTKATENGDIVKVEGDCNEQNKCVEILFLGGTAAENSVSQIEKSVYSNVEKNVNVNRNKMDIKISGDYNGIIKGDHKPEIEFKDLLPKTNGIEKANSLSNDDEQLNTSSVIVHRDLESQVVKDYLESYCPTTLYNSPSYNCQHSNCDFNRRQRKHKIELEMKSVSVSTESTPRLNSANFEISDTNLVAEYKTQDYLIMQAIGMAPAVESVDMDKNSKPSIDFRMHTILKTLKEDSKITQFEKKFNLTKLQTNDSIKQRKEDKSHIDKPHIEKDDINSMLLKQLLNTYRAFYSPSIAVIVPENNAKLLKKPQPIQEESPLPQFQEVPCSSTLASELLQNRTNYFYNKPVPACMLNIPRSPILCPESTCKRMIFVSDFNKHLVVDHSHLPMERITPFQCKNFFLDARLAHPDTSKCHLLYLMRDKITNLGSSEYKDFIPILVMTTRISLNQMCGLGENTSVLDFFLIWVTGIAPEEFPISVTIIIWSRSDRIPSCHVVYSGQIYSIRKSQRALDVWQSGRMLLLSNQEIDILTCNGKEMLNLQLSVH